MSGRSLTLAPMRPSSPPAPTQEVREIQRKILPPQARPKPEPPPPQDDEPLVLEAPILDESDVTVPPWEFSIPDQRPEQ